MTTPNVSLRELPMGADWVKAVTEFVKVFTIVPCTLYRRLEGTMVSVLSVDT